MHTCGGIQHTTSSSSQSKRLFIYDLNTLSSSTVTDELLTKTCPWVTVLSSHWSGTQQTSALSKSTVPRDRSRGGRKSDLNLFISKFSSLTDCPLIHWPSQLKSTGLIDGFASIRKNIRSYICTGIDPGPTLSHQLIRRTSGWMGQGKNSKCNIRVFKAFATRPYSYDKVPVE